MSTLFISDLHLDPARPDITRQFMNFLQDEARTADALYILGDLFEAWVGDDDPEPEKRRAIAALKRLAEHGTPLFFMRGNRDFLVGDKFAEDSGCTLLQDPTTLDIHGTRVLLMHGDTLCTDDHEYQAFRRMTRDPEWQRQFLAMPLPQRLEIAAQARAESMAQSKGKPEAIMDVNDSAVRDVLSDHGVTLLLHGHTHRPDVHHFAINGDTATRIVLGDWYTQGSALYWDASGFRLERLPRAAQV